MPKFLVRIVATCALAALGGNEVGAQVQSSRQAARPRDPARLKEQYRTFAKMHDGDPIRGKELFFNEQRLACSRCHVVNSQGGSVGPDLSTAGDKFGRLDLI